MSHQREKHEIFREIVRQLSGHKAPNLIFPGEQTHGLG